MCVSFSSGLLASSSSELLQWWCFRKLAEPLQLLAASLQVSALVVGNCLEEHIQYLEAVQDWKKMSSAAEESRGRPSSRRSLMRKQDSSNQWQGHDTNLPGCKPRLGTVGRQLSEAT